MKLLLTSDTHRGFSTKTHRLHDKWARDLEVAAADVAVFVVAGDLASHKQHQFEGALKFWRRVAGTRPVLVVRGNHDLWDRDCKNLQTQRTHLHAAWFARHGVHHLESGPFWLDGVCFVGWDGWYWWRTQTNDLRHMQSTAGPGGDTWTWLQGEAWLGVQEAVAAASQAKAEDATTKVVGVTHFPIHPNEEGTAWSGNQGWWEHVTPVFDVLCYGHTHEPVRDQVVDGVRLLNAGSDYDKPKHLIVEI